MSDSSVDKGQGFMFGVIFLHWLFGLGCFILGSLSWKFIAVGSVFLLLAGLVLIAVAVDNDL